MINAKRRTEPPASLVSGTYAGDDVLQALHQDFLGKCYLCEVKVSLRDIAVDHRRPKADPRFAALACAWTNLFPICRICNERRPKKFPEGGLLDPTAEDEDVEARLLQTMRPSDTTGDEIPFFAAVDEGDRSAGNTARELDHIHNARGSIKAADLRRAIAERLDEVLTLKLERERSGVVRGPVLRACEDGLREAFSRRAPFTALIRGRLGAGLEHLFD